MDRTRLLFFACATLNAVCLLAVVWIGFQEGAKAFRTAPSITSANPGDVVINEIAWMGTSASYNDEWIELYNPTHSPIPLTDWILAADDGTPSITLEGVIPAGGFFLLERTDDSTISDIPADQTYTGPLENDPAAETLRLRDENGSIIDTVNGDGGGWPAGDNNGKQTMERKDPLVDGGDANWANNDGQTLNGFDADGNPIKGTPRTRNSAYIGPSPDECDLVVTKTGPVKSPPGSNITYTLRLRNIGSAAASAVRLTDSLPNAVAFIAQYSSLDFRQSGDLLIWTAGHLPAASIPLLITVTGMIDSSASGTIVNTVETSTPTSETNRTNNHDTWETIISSSPGAATVLIGALLYDGYQTNDQDEAVQLINTSDRPIDLSGWKICDRPAGGSCATIPSGTLDPHGMIWLAYWATAFYASSGHYPAYAITGLAPGTLALSGSWPRYANAGEQVVLRDGEDQLVDVIVYGAGDTSIPGWDGASIEPWSGREGFGVEGQVLYRRLDEATGRPVWDTDTAADWAQYVDDPTHGRRVRYPGWDIETFFQPLSVREAAHVTVGVAPDNAADVVLDALDAAKRQIEIGVYALSHPTIINKLVDQAKAGVTVTVLLEGDQAGVAKTDARWHQQMWACQELYKTGSGACWFMVNDDQANIFDRYRFMHAKYIIVDRKWVLISSQNLTPKGLPDDDRSNGTHGSRGTVLVTDAPSVVARVAKIFDHDLAPAHHMDLLAWAPTGDEYGPPPPDYTPVLTTTDYTTYTVVFSEALALEGTIEFELLSAPEAALRQTDSLLGLLARASAGDEVYVETMDERAHWGENPADDPSLRMEAYIAAARRGARVRILLNSGWFDAEYYDATQNIIAAAYANGVAHQEGLDLTAATGDPTHYGIHNKMILVWIDGEGGYAHLGSLNGSETSNKINREIAIQLQSSEVYNYLKRVFEYDWQTSTSLYLPLVARHWRPPGPPARYPLISEVLYNPAGSDDRGEWVEIYNPTDETVALGGWYVGDVALGGEFGSGVYRFPPGATLPAKGVLLIARQAVAVETFTPDFEFLVDAAHNNPLIPDMIPAGNWDGFGFALGNLGDEVLLLDATAAPVDILVYGTGYYPGIVPHPGVGTSDHSLERRPVVHDSEDCSLDFIDLYPPDPGGVHR